MHISRSASFTVRPWASYQMLHASLYGENIKRSDYSRRGWLVRDQTMPVCSLELNPSFS